MNLTREGGHADIVRLTKAAAKAAEFGRWDAVAQYYHERGALLATMQVSAKEASDLLEIDEQIRARVRTVQVALASLLSAATATRHRLQSLHQRLGVQNSTAVTVSMKV